MREIEGKKKWERHERERERERERESEKEQKKQKKKAYILDHYYREKCKGILVW